MVMYAEAGRIWMTSDDMPPQPKPTAWCSRVQVRDWPAPTRMWRLRRWLRRRLARWTWGPWR